MAYCTLAILQLASGIYRSLGSPSSISAGYISGVITSSGQLGDLNNKLTICTYMTGDSPCIVGMGPEEANIMSLSIQSDYYQTRVNQILDGGGSFWTEMTEGDTKIRRESATNVAKVYLSLHNDTQEELRFAVQDWKRGHSSVFTVDGSSLYSFPPA